MNLKRILLIAAGIGIFANTFAQVKKTYYVPKPGTLVELMTEEEANQIT